MKNKIPTPSLKALEKLGRHLALNPHKIMPLAEYAVSKASHNKKRLQKVWEDLQVFLRLLRAWGGGRYSQVPWRTLVLVAGAVIYFVNPFDLIPDFIASVGLLDDVAVISTVLSAIRHDIDRFHDWEIISKN